MWDIKTSDMKMILFLYKTSIKNIENIFLLMDNFAELFKNLVNTYITLQISFYLAAGEVRCVFIFFYPLKSF